MSESVADRIGDRTEYGVEYTAPAEYKGLVSNVRSLRSIAEGVVRQENNNVNNVVHCRLVARTVTYGAWVVVSR